MQTTHSVIKLQAPCQKNLLQLIIHIICHCALKCSQAIKLVFYFALLFILLPPSTAFSLNIFFFSSMSSDSPSFSTEWLNGEKTRQHLSHAHRKILFKCPSILCWCVHNLLYLPWNLHLFCNPFLYVSPPLSLLL